MSDFNRGAYAPQGSGPAHDEPLRFDTYDNRARARRPLPMTLIGSGVVLLLLVTALVMFYRGGSKGAAGVARPVGGTISAIKTAPAGAQPSEPGAGLEVYSPQNVPSASVAAAPAAPQFAPAPEQPMVRPAPPPPLPVKVAIAKTAPVATPLKESPAKPSAAPAAIVKLPLDSVASAPFHKPPSADGAAAVLQTTTASGPTAPVAAKAPGKAVIKTAMLAARPKPGATLDENDDPEENATSTGSADPGLITTRMNGASAKSVRSDTLAETSTAAKAKAATAKLAAAAAAKRKPVALANAAARDEDAGPALPRGPLSPAKPKTIKLATTSSSIKPAMTSTGGGFAVQVGAFPSAADADKGFSAAASKVASAGGKARHVETVQKDGKTYYRSTLKGFGSKADAAAFCATLRAKGGQCIVRGAAG